MFPFEQYDALAKKLFAVLPPSLQSFEKETEQKFKEILQSVFAKLDLVTREEFDVQTKVLARTREKIEALQAELSAMKESKGKTGKGKA